jgi:large subunit ribosomal protein L18
MKTPNRQSRHRKVRSIVAGTPQRPRLVVYRGSKTLSAQLIDDTTGTTLLTLQTKPATVAAAEKLGGAVATAAQKQKITAAVFDRAGYKYHGAVRALAEAARGGGLTI